jgi:hypothetical protein
LTSTDDVQVAVMLRPAAEPGAPRAESFTYGQGWHLQAAEGWRWAYEDAALFYFNPHPRPLTVDVKFDVMGATPRELFLERDGEIVRRVQATETSTPQVLSRVELVPGVNRFKLRSPADAVRHGAGRNQLQSYGLHNVTVRPSLEANTAKM